LLHESVQHVQEFRNVSLVAVPPLQPYSGDGDVGFSNPAILAGATQFQRKIALFSTYLRGAAQTIFSEISARKRNL